MRTAARGLALAGLVLALAPAPPARAEADALAREIVAFSSRGAQLASMAEQVQLGIERNGASLPLVTRELLLRAVAVHLAPEALRSGVVERLAPRIEPARAGEVLRWLKSPLGRRVTRLEQEASTPEGLAGLEAFAQQLHDALPPRSRLELMRRIEAAGRAVDFTLDVTARTSLGIALALDATLPASDQSSPEQLRAFIESQRVRLLPVVEQSVRVAYLYRYRDVSDENLGHYAEFLESEAGVWYVRETQHALLETLAEASLALGDAIAKELAPPESAPTGSDQSARRARSFSHTPPKSPLLITSTTSPGRQSATRSSTMASTPSRATASVPRAARSLASRGEEKRSVTSPVAL
jgi:hypothetical protein